MTSDVVPRRAGASPARRDGRRESRESFSRKAEQRRAQRGNRVGMVGGGFHPSEQDFRPWHGKHLNRCGSRANRGFERASRRPPTSRSAARHVPQGPSFPVDRGPRLTLARSPSGAFGVCRMVLLNAMCVCKVPRSRGPGVYSQRRGGLATVPARRVGKSRPIMCTIEGRPVESSVWDVV